MARVAAPRNSAVYGSIHLRLTGITLNPYPPSTPSESPQPDIPKTHQNYTRTPLHSLKTKPFNNPEQNGLGI